MGLSMNIFLNDVDDSLIPQWLDEYKKHGMICEIHPEFSFTDQVGFLPIKLRLENPVREEWANKDYMTGFEFYMDDFDLNKELLARSPKPPFLKALFGAKRDTSPFVSAEIDEQLAKYKKHIALVWGGGDSFALRMATVSAGILAKLCNGLCAYEDEVWYDNADAMETLVSDAVAYEGGLSRREIETNVFESW